MAWENKYSSLTFYKLFYLHNKNFYGYIIEVYLFNFENVFVIHLYRLVRPKILTTNHQCEVKTNINFEFHFHFSKIHKLVQSLQISYEAGSGITTWEFLATSNFFKYSSHLHVLLSLSVLARLFDRLKYLQIRIFTAT